MKKRILAIDQGEHLGGAERFFSELLTRVETHEVHLVTSGNPEYKKFYKDSAVIIHELPLPKLKPVRIGTLLEFRKARQTLGKLIETIQPTTIISNTVRTHLLISSLAKKKKIPLIWMGHDLTFPQVLMRWCMRYPQTVISCSKFVESFFKKNTKRKNIRWEIIYPFGIERNRLIELQKIKKEKIIGMVGKFIPWKNQKSFIELASEIHQRYPDYQFTLVGSPYEGNVESEMYFEECKDFIRQKELQKILNVKTQVPDILKEISTWEILIHCSTSPEPLGRVVMEGMASGCAVIASPFGGPSEVIQHRATGVLTRPDMESLKRETIELIHHPEDRMKISQSAQNEIQEKYTWEKVIHEFNKLI
jgi:glycosyltransferase involved in cell wall biosynthesis